jgi:ankyrin repeat protein
LLQDFLTLAIDDGDLSRVRKLLKDGAIVHMDISEKDNCLDHPLVRAAARGQLRITQAFLNELQQEHHGLSFEQRQKLETAAFVTACGEGAEELVDYFLLMRQDTVDVNCVFNEKTALSTAVACKQADVVELLLESGVCVTREDLEVAHRAGFADVAATILCKYPNLLCSRDVQFLQELHACIDEGIVETKEELKEYMRAHDLGTIV